MEKLKEKLLKENKKEKAEIAKRIKEYKKEDSETNTNRLLEWHFRRYLTKKQYDNFINKKITKAQAIKIAMEKEAAEIDKRTENKLKKLETVESAENLESFKIVVEWKRNATWGMNPTATLQQWAGTWSETTGHASGCGYDKKSAAVAEALNKSNSILKELFNYKEKQLKKGKSDKSKMSCNGIDNRNIIAYGAGYSILPYFEGGVGMNCFVNIFRILGFKCNETHTKTTDVYIFTRK